MSSEPDDSKFGLCDVYRDGRHGRVRMFVVAGTRGRAWRLADGNAI